MSNLSIAESEVAFLRSAVLKKFCDIIGYDVSEYSNKLTGTIKYYEEISFVIQQELEVNGKLETYFDIISETSVTLFKRQFSNIDLDDRRIQRECVNSISANVLRKLIFNGLSEVSQTYKSQFIYSCYFFIGVDRSDFLKNDNARITKDITGLRTKGIAPDQTIKPSFNSYSANNLAHNIEQNTHIRLIPVSNDNVIINDKPVLEFKEGSVILNRNNIDPGNNTLTSKTQAELKHTDGKWTIENFSTLKTTYIQVLRPHELKPGDVIVMGNLRFLVE